MLKRLQALLAPAGITRVADLTGLDRIGIPVALVVRPNSRGLSVSQGKGLDLLSAKVSGIMEALEGFHAERLDLPVRLLRYSDIARSGRAVDPDRLPRRRASRFHPDRHIPWTEATDLATGETRIVPFELVHTDFTCPPPPGSGCFPMSSNGLAGGATRTLALVHGICEVIERDAYALSVHRGTGARPIVRQSISEPILVGLLDRIAGVGCAIRIEELTSEIGVPVFMTTIWGGSASPVTAAPAGGIGCHPDRNRACVRAILEAAQSRLTRLSGVRDDLTGEQFTARSDGGSHAPGLSANGARHGGIDGSLGVEDLQFCAGPGFRGETDEADLAWLLDKLQDAGFPEILVVNLDHPEFGLPIVRVIIPGLEHPPSGNVIPGPRARGAV